MKSPLPLPPLGQRIWLFFYAITSGIYRVLVGVTIILVVTNQVPVLGVLMALGGVVTWLVVPVGKILNYLLLEPELHRKRFRAAAFVGGGGGGDHRRHRVHAVHRPLRSHRHGRARRRPQGVLNARSRRVRQRGAGRSRASG